MNIAPGGILVGYLVQMTCVVLKLAGVLDWSWWWVLAPIWIDLIAALLIIIVGVLHELLWERVAA